MIFVGIGEFWQTPHFYAFLRAKNKAIWMNPNSIRFLAVVSLLWNIFCFCLDWNMNVSKCLSRCGFSMDFLSIFINLRKSKNCLPTLNFLLKCMAIRLWVILDIISTFIIHETFESYLAEFSHIKSFKEINAGLFLIFGEYILRFGGLLISHFSRNFWSIQNHIQNELQENKETRVIMLWTIQNFLHFYFEIILDFENCFFINY